MSDILNRREGEPLPRWQGVLRATPSGSPDSLERSGERLGNLWHLRQSL